MLKTNILECRQISYQCNFCKLKRASLDLCEHEATVIFFPQIIMEMLKLKRVRNAILKRNNCTYMY